MSWKFSPCMLRAWCVGLATAQRNAAASQQRANHRTPANPCDMVNASPCLEAFADVLCTLAETLPKRRDSPNLKYYTTMCADAPIL
eukprot:4469735-Amphidinium_carterae.2